MSSSSDDSSEDENLQRFKEALDVRFINDSMYSDSKKSTEEAAEKPKPLPSKRPVEQEFVMHHIKVTPEFQAHVSKQLSQFLDKQIKEVSKKEKPEKSEPEVKHESGVYLLSSSTKYLSCEEPTEESLPVKGRKFRLKNSEAEGKDLSEVVVSPEWVLNQEGTKGWQKNAKKSVLFSYKKNKKGVLELISEKL